MKVTYRNAVVTRTGCCLIDLVGDWMPVVVVVVVYSNAQKNNLLVFD
jgi:hypothetical protein